MLDIRVYVINLDRAPDRLAAMESQLRSFPMAHERISAFDAANVTKDMMNAIAAPRLGRLFRYMSGYHRSEEFSPACSGRRSAAIWSPARSPVT